MITCTGYRIERGYPDKPWNFPVQTFDMYNAFRSLVKYELGYGGVISEITETSITVKTRILDKIDTTTFTAETKEEILPLLEAAFVFIQCRQKEMDNGKFIDRVMDVTKGKPLLISLAGGILAGEGFVLPVTVGVLLGSLEHLNVFKGWDYDNVISAIQLMRDDGATIDDIIAINNVEVKSYVERRLEAVR